MRALILGAPVLQTARVVWSWLMAGNEIQEIWISHRSSPVSWRRDGWLQRVAPTWSLRAASEQYGIPIRRVPPLRRNPDVADQGCKPSVDVVLSATFPYVVPDSMLNYYRSRACNLHPALLPRFAGPCPLVSMIVEEAMSASGMTLHQMSSELDAGDVIAQESVAWPRDEWFRTWDADLADAGARLASKTLPEYLAGKTPATSHTNNVEYHRQVDARHLHITPSLTADKARWLGRSLGQIMPLSMVVNAKQYQVGDVTATVGKPTGHPPRIRTLSIECDVADARLKFNRWNTIRRKWERARELVSLAQRPLAA